MKMIIILCCAVLITCSSNKSKSGISNSEINMNSQQKTEAAKLAEQLEQKGISDQLVLKAIAAVPRHEFVDEEIRGAAYLDKPLPIEKGQTISQPYTVAYQSELLRIKPGDKVLEIGTGSGYQAAILCEMGAEVYSIERIEELYLSAKKTLNALGYFPNLFYGDGYEGLPENAPFDKILVTAAPVEIPQKLLYQLRIGGWMVVPLGGRGGQKMTIIKRTGKDAFEESEHGDFIFVPMQKGIGK
jgi:protein-L-isoaspartate(D-aspartate) O-methyltransferase